MTKKPQGTNIIIKTTTIIGLVFIVAIVGFYILDAPDRRTTGDKIGDAVDELPNGLDKAARQLEDLTPADKIHDAAKDARDDLQKSTD